MRLAGPSRRLLLAGLAAWPLVAQGGVLARRRTRFGRLEVREQDGLRVLVEDGQIHSGFDPEAPERLVFPYLRMLAAGVAVREAPAGRALVIGVGGGAFSSWLARSGWTVTGVDVNRVAVALGRRFLGMDPSVEVVIGDGRRFLDRATGPWDLVVLDASTEDYVPPQLRSVECFQRVEAVLASGGVALMNSWWGAPRADDELAAWREVFPSAWTLTLHGTLFENRVLLGRATGGDPTRRIHEIEPDLVVAKI